jgi:hypothetical protein
MRRTGNQFGGKKRMERFNSNQNPAESEYNGEQTPNIAIERLDLHTP